jgi:aminoglycoside phosphotransferase (APT) family kinase protein
MGYDLAADGFHTTYDSQMPPGVVGAVDALRGRVDALAAAMCEGPNTLVHGDFRVDNLVFAADGGPPLVFDWQAISRGSGVVDAAQLITLGLRPDDRRAHETALLRTYHEGLAEGGVTISEDDLMAGYRLGIAYLFAVSVAQTLQLTEQKGSDVAVWVERSVAALGDHGLPDF